MFSPHWVIAELAVQDYEWRILRQTHAFWMRLNVT